MRSSFASISSLPALARCVVLPFFCAASLLTVSTHRLAAQEVPPPPYVDPSPADPDPITDPTDPTDPIDPTDPDPTDPTTDPDPTDPTIDPIIYTTAVNAGPVVPRATVSAVAGQPFSYQIGASNLPTSFAALNLPDGLTLNATTGLISGTPLYAGNYKIALSATNATSTGKGKLKLTVFLHPVPVVTITPEKNASISGDDSKAGSFLLTRTGGDLTDYVEVTYTVSGNALGGVNYQSMKGTAIIKGAKGAKRLKIQPLDASDFAGRTSVKITLETGLGYMLGAQTTAKLKVIDAK